MTIEELKKAFEEEFPELIAKGCRFSAAYPLYKPTGITKSVPEGAELDPDLHELSMNYPYIIPAKKMPEKFKGFKIMYFIGEDDVPEEFRGEWQTLEPWDVCWDPEKVMAYAEAHALEICEELNDYTLTLTDICGMLVHGDFEKHKQKCEEQRKERLERMLSGEDEEDFEDEDFDDEDFDDEDFDDEDLAEESPGEDDDKPLG